MFTVKCCSVILLNITFSVYVGWVVTQWFQDSCRVERIETRAGDWLLCPLTGLWGKVGEGPEETQWRTHKADWQFNGSSEQISHPHTDQTRVHCYWPTRTAHPLSLPTLNSLVEKESHKVADELRGGRLCRSPPPASHPVSLVLSHMLSLSFLYQVVVSISPNPFPPECLKRWKDKEKNGDKGEEGYVTTLPLRDCSWKSLGMGEIGTGEETQKEKGDHEKRFFKLKAAKTGHFCMERQTKVRSSLMDGDI